MTPSRALIFETSTPCASLALAGAGHEIRQREFTGDRSHNATLFTPLRELLTGVPGHEIGLVIVGSGPGSYSGTRVGIAAAQGVAIAYGCPAVAVPSILATESSASGAPCLAIGDARRGSYWTARMENFALKEDPQLTDAEGLESLVAAAAGNGMAVISFEPASRFPLSEDLQNHVKVEFPNASRLWAVWNCSTAENRASWQNVPPQPMYLKPPHITPAKRPWLVQPQP